MKVLLYSLKDCKLDRYQPPFACRSDNEARIIISRAGFSDVVYRDLDLFKVGEFDDETGKFFIDEKKVGLIANGGDKNEN